MKYIKYLIITFVFSGLTLSSCQDFLDVSDELAEEQTLEKIFSTPSSVRRWHRNIYEGIPNTMKFHWPNGLMGNHFMHLADETISRYYSRFPYTRALSPVDDQTLFGRWHLYQYIRQANMFLEHAVEIPVSGDADYLSLNELNELKAQARFLRAMYYFYLFELYGPIPIIDEAADPENQDLDFARNSVDEVVDYVYNELTAIYDELKDPNYSRVEELALPSKGTALAYRAKMMVYAASPLYNGGYTEALELENHDGKKLFSPYDANKWQKAVDALQDFIDYANSGHYELYKVYKNGVLDPHASIYEVLMKFNPEIIFARSDMQGALTGEVGSWDRFNVPIPVRGGTANTTGPAVVQELVDDYFMIDGLKIDESPLYREDGFSTPGEDLSGQTEVGTFRMFINREPRFYQTVFYSGRKWHIGGEQVFFGKAGNNGDTAEPPMSGHMIYKRVSKAVYHQSPYPATEYRPAMIFRLAEFYLLYAEALNEVNPSDPRIIEYVDKVRERAGIPLLADIKPEIIGNQSAQRKAIQQESRVELATEGQRYFDVKRWMIAENQPGEGGLGGDFHGMDMGATTLDGFFNRVVIQKRVFERRELLSPLPQNEVAKSKLLIQNPGY